MSKPGLLGLTLLTILTVGALAAPPAFALSWESALWFVSGTEAKAELAAEDKATLLFEDSSFGAIECKVGIVGTIGPGSADLTTEILNEAGIAVSLASPALCKAVKTCESSTTTVEMAPEGLPWETEVVVDSETGFFFDLVLSSTFWAKCLVVGISVSDECTTTSGATLIQSVAGGVEYIGVTEPHGKCTFGGEGTGIVEFFPGNAMNVTGGGTLEVRKGLPEWLKTGGALLKPVAFSTANTGAPAAVIKSPEPPVENEITCVEAGGSGSVEAPNRIEGLTIKFKKCTSNILSGKDDCHFDGNPSKGGEINLEPLHGRIGYVEPKNGTVTGAELEPAAGTVAKIKCVEFGPPEGSVKFVLKGCVVAEVNPVNKEQLTIDLVFAENLKKQLYTEITGGMHKPCELSLEREGGKTEPARLDAHERITFAEELEAKA